MIKRQSGRIKVFVVDDETMDGVSWWRAACPFGALEKLYGNYLEIVRCSERVDVRDLMTADIVVRFRPMTENSFKFLKLCREFGAKIIIDLDDDLWHVPPSHPVFGDSLQYRDTMQEMYDFADWVWVSTPGLLQSADRVGRGEVMPNAILPSELPDEPLPYKGVAAWRGNDKQIADILSDEAKAWYETAKDLYSQWIFAGYFPDLPHGANATFQRRLDPLAYFLSLKNGLANVFWKPLQVNQFNDNKSNIAWIEATMSGAVCVTNYAGRNGWQCAFAEFPTNPELIAEAWAASKEHILKNYNLLDVTEKRFQSMMNLI